MFLLILILFLISILKVVIVLRGGRVVKHEELYVNLDDISVQPLYTIIIPIFMEKNKEVLGIRCHLLQMNYTNFEILYICEDVDIVLVNYINSLNLNNFERVVQVPRLAPLTKPKACNYGLEFAKGEYIVVYDAEDRPHHMQLQVAAYVLRSKNCSCVQFPLEFISDGTIIGLWQRIDYLVWYQRLLPVVSHFRLPIPLGGTSNHFKVSVLRQIEGWDAYNVTEDAELGLRMFQMGIGVEFVCGYQTKEVTVKNIINLIKQRVRWSKGHVITAVSFLMCDLRFRGVANCLAVFFVLMSTQVCYIVYVFLTFSYGFYQDKYLLNIIIFSMMLFFLHPLFLFVSFQELRSHKNITATTLLPFYYTLYAIPIIISLIECVFKPSVWYKTKR